jgi:hypothetical protein
MQTDEHTDRQTDCKTDRHEKMIKYVPLNFSPALSRRGLQPGTQPRCWPPLCGPTPGRQIRPAVLSSDLPGLTSAAPTAIAASLRNEDDIRKCASRSKYRRPGRRVGRGDGEDALFYLQPSVQQRLLQPLLQPVAFRLRRGGSSGRPYWAARRGRPVRGWL